MPAIAEPGPLILSVIIPARNEEANLGACLESLASQPGVAHEIIVVDDHSIDRTAEIARSFPCVRVLTAPELREGWTGKNNAVAAGAAIACGEWLLFTDADTVHAADSLSASLEEAKLRQAALISYSPEQVVGTFWEKAVMPVIFAELAATFRPQDVSNPASAAAAANGQFILVRRDVYHAVGGHEAIAGELLEDVALARAVKRAGYKIFFRYGGDRVRTRMYRSFDQLREGWTKNLALLFGWPWKLAALRLAEFAFVLVGIAALLVGVIQGRLLLGIAGLLPALISFLRLRRAHFSTGTTLLSLIGLPVFSYLLIRSLRFHAQSRVTWKGRKYPWREAEVNPGPQLGV
jgi:glycosyltransferase involved in cell wall biosynthesis